MAVVVAVGVSLSYAQPPAATGSVRPAARPQRSVVLAAVDRAGRGLHRADRGGDQGGPRPHPRSLRALHAVPDHRHRDGPADHRPLDADEDGRHRQPDRRVQRLDLLDGRGARRHAPGHRGHGRHDASRPTRSRTSTSSSRTCRTSGSRRRSSARRTYGYRRLIDMRELDDCGAIGAALIKANAKKPDPRYKEGIDLAADAHPDEAAAPARRHARAAAAGASSRSGSTMRT